MEKVKNEGIFNSLTDQLKKLRRHTRQGSYGTRQRYYEAMQTFCVYLADVWHLQRLANIRKKHVEGYVWNMQERGCSASTIKTTLSAIRFWYDQIPGDRPPLPANDQLSVTLEQRTLVGVDRAWTEPEYLAFLQLAEEKGEVVFAAVTRLTWHTGLRIHECFRIDRATAIRAIKSGQLTIKGKNGKLRSVPVDKEAKVLLQVWVDRTQPGQKLFVREGVPTDKAIKQMQRFIREHRDAFQIDEAERPRTHHGLRHAYAAREYTDRIRDGKTVQDAKQEVSQELGHNRPEVTDIYLAVHKKK